MKNCVTIKRGEEKRGKEPESDGGSKEEGGWDAEHYYVTFQCEGDEKEKIWLLYVVFKVYCKIKGSCQRK